MFRRLTTFQLVLDITVSVLAVALRLTMQIDNRAFLVAILLMGAALAVNRLSPALALGLAWAGAIIQMYSGVEPDLANLAILVVLYSTARNGVPPVKWAGLASAGVGAVVASLYVTFRRPGYIAEGDPVFFGTPQALVFQLVVVFIAFAALLGISWTIGLLVRTRRNARESKAREALAEHAVVIEQERNRIARDMHDVVAHSLAVVIAQADGARYAAPNDPDAADEALTTIAATAREALADVRMLLGQLRHNQEQGPQPMLADLATLIDQLRASGLDVAFTENGSAPVLPASQQLAIYRIVQEALTNALRHGEVGGRVEVVLDWTPNAASLSITNPLRAGEADAPHSGHGITGMRERALLVGGLFTAQPVGDSFAVAATIPVPVHA